MSISSWVGSCLCFAFGLLVLCNCNSGGAESGIFANCILTEVPVFVDQTNTGLISISLSAENPKDLKLSGLRIEVQQMAMPLTAARATVRLSAETDAEGAVVFGSSTFETDGWLVEGDYTVHSATYQISVDVDLDRSTSLSNHWRVAKVRLLFDGAVDVELVPTQDFVYRPAVMLRAAGQDNCHTYRIPGVATTNQGTLIAVYDNRYHNSADLQGDIDVGMSRSTNGGQTWEPSRVIMDMGTWGGRPNELNGIGDPAILYDHLNHTIWVAALWMSGLTSGDRLWRASQPGMSPEETGQIILVRSDDDGLTWSEPINITHQIKDPAWQLFFTGPGMGITLPDGTLVFAAQYKADLGQPAIDGGQFTPLSTLIYSRDGGTSWQVGTGALDNTTEAQIVALTDGSLMINMRDDRNRKVKDPTNGRAVATTADMGKTWLPHASSHGALPEPNCMASLIAAHVSVRGRTQQVLFFSNPNSREERKDITIKASLDQGLSWPEELQIRLYGPKTYGYSCLTMVDDRTLGIVYEGTGDLYFQKIPLDIWFDR